MGWLDQVLNSGSGLGMVGARFCFSASTAPTCVVLLLCPGVVGLSHSFLATIASPASWCCPAPLSSLTAPPRLVSPHLTREPSRHWLRCCAADRWPSPASLSLSSVGPDEDEMKGAERESGVRGGRERWTRGQEMRWKKPSKAPPLLVLFVNYCQIFLLLVVVLVFILLNPK